MVSNHPDDHKHFKIIEIPQDHAAELERAAEEFCDKHKGCWDYYFSSSDNELSFISGAKWQAQWIRGKLGEVKENVIYAKNTLDQIYASQLPIDPALTRAVLDSLYYSRSALATLSEIEAALKALSEGGET